MLVRAKKFNVQKKWVQSHTQKQLAINYNIFFDTVDFSSFQEAKPISKLIFFFMYLNFAPLLSGFYFIQYLCILFDFIQLFHPFFVLQNKFYIPLWHSKLKIVFNLSMILVLCRKLFFYLTNREDSKYVNNSYKGWKL